MYYMEDKKFTVYLLEYTKGYAFDPNTLSCERKIFFSVEKLKKYIEITPVITSAVIIPIEVEDIDYVEYKLKEGIYE